MHRMTIPNITIANRQIGPDHPPYMIAELSANHNGSLETAFRIVSEAALAGADAVKLQTYRPDTITLDSNAPEFIIRGGLWDGRRLFDLYAEAMTPWEWHKPLFDHARECGITIFSSPFDSTAVDLLEDLGSPAYKIASFEAVDIPLIRYVAGTGKPMIISTGMADQAEIAEAIAAARDGGCGELAILHCVSGYPAPAADYNLRTIPDMASRFGLVTGISDHTLSSSTAIAAVALGAAIVEKHVTLDREGGGFDDSFSLEPQDLAQLCRDLSTAWKALGRVDYRLQSSEQSNANYRRSLYFVKALEAGDIVTIDAIRSVRPGFGLAPKYLESILGRRVVRDIAAATPVKLEDVA